MTSFNKSGTQWNERDFILIAGFVAGVGALMVLADVQPKFAFTLVGAVGVVALLTNSQWISNAWSQYNTALKQGVVNRG